MTIDSPIKIIHYESPQAWLVLVSVLNAKVLK